MKKQKIPNMEKEKKTSYMSIHVDEKTKNMLKKIRAVEIFNLSSEARNVIQKRYLKLKNQGIIE